MGHDAPLPSVASTVADGRYTPVYGDRRLVKIGLEGSNTVSIYALQRFRIGYGDVVRCNSDKVAYESILA